LGHRDIRFFGRFSRRGDGEIVAKIALKQSAKIVGLGNLQAFETAKSFPFQTFIMLKTKRIGFSEKRKVFQKENFSERFKC